MIWVSKIMWNKWFYHKSFLNKELYLMFCYEPKLYWRKVCWLYERPWKYFSHICNKKQNILTFFRFHCGYLEIETINPLSFINLKNEYIVVNNHIVWENPSFSNLNNVDNFWQRAWNISMFETKINNEWI